MNSISKLAVLGGFLAVALAHADTVTLAATPAALGANDTVDWKTGLVPAVADGGTIPHSFTAVSAGARTVTGTFTTTTGIRVTVCNGCSWSPLTGDFTNNEGAVWSFDAGANAGTGPVTFSVAAAISGFGAVVQTDAVGQFTAKVELFNAANVSLGSVTRTSNAAGDAIFIGALDTTAPNATKAVFSITAGPVGADLADFATGMLQLNAPAAALVAPTITKAFNPATIVSGGTSLVTLTLSNSNASALTGAAFTDMLVNMKAVGGAVGGTCVGTTPNTLAAGATALSFSGITIPANGSCTVTFSVTSTNVGPNPNQTSGVTTTQTPVAGAPSNVAILTVTAAALVPPTITKAFNPTSIVSGGTSLVTLTLSNSNASALTGAAFTDTLVNMSAVGGAVGGTCVGTTPNALAAGATALSFSGITIPANGSCTVTFSVTSTNVGLNPNQTSGVTTTQTPVAGPASNIAILTVTAAVGPTEDDTYQLRYLANLDKGDSYVNFTNAGTLNGFDPAGRLCVNVYTFDPAEELISCCACPVTPNGLASLSARNDLISNTLTPGVPTSITVKLLSSLPIAGVCNAASPNAANLVRGMRAWATTIHLNTAVPPAPGVYQETETPFSKVELSATELSKLTSFCGFIQANGSGFGICKSCRTGALGAEQK